MKSEKPTKPYDFTISGRKEWQKYSFVWLRIAKFREWESIAKQCIRIWESKKLDMSVAKKLMRTFLGPTCKFTHVSSEHLGTDESLPWVSAENPRISAASIA
jgi:hypothetical protein